MDRITLQNYRCFGSEEQSARLAPLTLLVGPNSTGKTSFLALIRALWDVAFRDAVPNFREEPFDLGSFDEIAYSRGGRHAASQCFFASFTQCAPLAANEDVISFATKFINRQTAPFPIIRDYGDNRVAVRMPTAHTVDEEPATYRIGEGHWRPLGENAVVGFSGLAPVEALERSSITANDSDQDALQRFFGLVRSRKNFIPRPYANAPTRSRPLRTYNPSLLARDSEGDHVASLMAYLSRNDEHHWANLKGRVEEFGSESELFDEIKVRSFGTSDGDPFQIQVRKYGGSKSRRRKGPWHNLIDVGYGVSQVLPMLIELLRLDGRFMFLLQQPEVHLHPQAQAALGTLFCQVAAGDRQLIIETHSDYIIDRVRMDVRDGTTGLKPEDVSILYFEPGDLAVKIHSIRIDKAGNVLDAPEGYRQFFTDEMMRSIWA